MPRTWQISESSAEPPRRRDVDVAGSIDQVVQDARPEELFIRILAGEADSALRRKVLPEEQDASPVRFQAPVENLQQGALPGTGRPEDGHVLLFSDNEIDLFERWKAALKSEADFLQF